MPDANLLEEVKNLTLENSSLKRLIEEYEQGIERFSKLLEDLNGNH